MEYIIEPSIENLLLELKKRARQELVTNEGAYEELVDELIAEKIEWGEINENDDYNIMREDLIGRWPDVLEYVESKETKHP
ncbi:MAG TPA: hypothetical protein VK254_03245 [Candidatus Bathyarchaeia archaeon]|nr:hypothetical protein [Candidatus Bathyarchaeia archaeon]